LVEDITSPTRIGCFSRPVIQRCRRKVEVRPEVRGRWWHFGRPPNVPQGQGIAAMTGSVGHMSASMVSRCVMDSVDRVSISMVPRCISSPLRRGLGAIDRPSQSGHNKT